MASILAVVMLGGVAIAQLGAVGSNSQEVDSPRSALESPSLSGHLPALPAAPQGKSTVLGGQIVSIDRVRDELMLKVFGQRQTKILFDERTKVYRDGKEVPLRELTSAGHASVETLLDGTSVFALRIHILSRTPEDVFRGSVLHYTPSRRELTVSAPHLRDPVKLLLPVGTPVVRTGQGQFSSGSSGVSDLVWGTLISVTYGSDKDGRAVATQIDILATPGSAFVFSGNLSSLDMHTGSLVLVDSRDDKDYQIFFDSAQFPASPDLHDGVHVRVVATYNGTHYVASELAFN